MKTNKLIQFWSILLVFLMALGVGNAWGAIANPYSFTFSNSELGTYDTSFTKGEVTWSLTDTKDSYNGNVGKYGYIFGSAGSPKPLTVYTSGISGAITQVTVTGRSNNKDKTAIVSVTVGSTVFTTSDDSWDNGNNQTLTFTGSASGTICVHIEPDACGLSLYGISVTYSTTSKTVTFDKQGGTFDDESVFTRTSPSHQIDGASITLPSVSPSSSCASEGWGFYGWATSAVGSSTTTTPAIVGKAGDTYYPSANTTLYAVFAQGEYTKEKSTITDDAKYLIVATNSGGDNYILKYGNDKYYDAENDEYYTGGPAAQINETSSEKYAAYAVNATWAYTFDQTSSSYYIRDNVNAAATNYVDFTYSGTWYKYSSSSVDHCTFSVSDGVWSIKSDYDSDDFYFGFDEDEEAFFAYGSAQDILLYKAGTIYYYSNPSCCDKEVALSYNSAGSSNVSTMTFSETSLATCSSTAGDREVTITVTPSTGYFFKSGDRLTWTKSSGTIPSDPTYVSGPTLSAGKYNFVYRFAQSDNGAGTFAATSSTYTNYRTTCSATYDIELDKNGGDADGSATVALNGTQLKNISAPTKTGYKVAGYYAESGKTNLVAAADGTLEADVEISSDDWTNGSGEWVKRSGATLYAKWEAISYSVRFNKNNGSATGTMSNESYDYDESKKLTDNAFSLTGYTFAGWATTSDGSVAHTDGKSVSNLSTTDGAVVDLYAVWTANKYTLTLAATNETSSVGSQTVQATYGSAMPLKTTADGTPAVAALSRTGYTFDGWEYSSTQYYSYNAGTSTLSSAHAWDVASTATLTPRWNVNSYTLTWDKNGGNALTGDYTSGSVNYGATITAPNTPTRSGYDFAGWDDGSGVVTPATTMPAGDVTYTATWTKKSASGWTWTYNSAAIPDPLVLYVGINKTLDITWDPSDLLSEKKGYTVTKTDSKVAQGGKGNDYYTMRGAAGVTEVTNTTVTFSLSGLSDVEVNVTVKPQPRVHFVDKIHGESFDDLLPTVVSYVATFVKATPTHSDVSDPGSNYNTCERQHLHLVGWILSTWADANPGASPSQITGAGSGKYYAAGADINVETHDGDTFYAVWSKVE